MIEHWVYCNNSFNLVDDPYISEKQTVNKIVEIEKVTYPESIVGMSHCKKFNDILKHCKIDEMSLVTGNSWYIIIGYRSNKIESFVEDLVSINSLTIRELMDILTMIDNLTRKSKYLSCETRESTSYRLLPEFEKRSWKITRNERHLLFGEYFHKIEAER